MAKTINDLGFYPVYYWMSSVLGLSGVEKDLYALIYGYHKTTGKACYYGYDSLVTITGASRNTVIRALKGLADKGYIEINKKETGKNYYSIIESRIPPIVE